MSNAILFPGFLNQALIFGFRIGETQISGQNEIENFLAEPSLCLDLQKASSYPAFSKICGGCAPTIPGVFAPVPTASDSFPMTSDQQVMEGFVALVDILCDGLEEDLEDSLVVLETGNVPVAAHDPADYDAACLAFSEALAQARNEARYAKPKPRMATLLPQLFFFTIAVNSDDPMELLTWSLRTVAALPSGWEFPELILQTIVARMEWKMLLFDTAAETLKGVGREMQKLRDDRHDWELEGQIHFLTGTALLVSSFLEIKDGLKEAMDELLAALFAFEKGEVLDAEMKARFAFRFSALGEIFDTRDRPEEALSAYRFAELMRGG